MESRAGGSERLEESPERWAVQTQLSGDLDEEAARGDPAVPEAAGLGDDGSSDGEFPNRAIDFLFLIDMSLQFFLGYWDHRLHMLIFDHRMIVNRWVTAREERRDTETVHA